MRRPSGPTALVCALALAVPLQLAVSAAVQADSPAPGPDSSATTDPRTGLTCADEVAVGELTYAGPGDVREVARAEARKATAAPVRTAADATRAVETLVDQGLVGTEDAVDVGAGEQSDEGLVVPVRDATGDEVAAVVFEQAESGLRPHVLAWCAS